MKQLTIFLIGIILSFQGTSQDRLFVLHPLVGDTIDRNEKLNYLLFRDINDSDFKYCTITHTKDVYFVHTRTIDDSVVLKQVDSTEIRETIVKLDKVMEYYSAQAKQDSIKKAIKLSLDFKDKDSNFKIDNIVSEDVKDRIFKEVRSENRMKGDAERLELREQGTERLTGAGRIEFYKRRKKNNDMIKKSLIFLLILISAQAFAKSGTNADFWMISQNDYNPKLSEFRKKDKRQLDY